MFESSFLRLVIVAALVTWSPGSWCACGHNAVDSRDGTVATNGSAVAALAGDLYASACCDQPAPVAVTGDCCGAGCDRRGSGEGRSCPSCPCIGGQADATPPVVVTLATQADVGVDLLVELPPSIAAVTEGIRRTRLWRGSPRGAAAQSLFELRCLMTT